MGWQHGKELEIKPTSGRSLPNTSSWVSSGRERGLMVHHYCNVEVIGGWGQCGAREARLARPRWRVVVGWTLHPRRRLGGGWGGV
jgi:hypothetical protein